MNARIQVEHPVTELVTSIDIVRRQLEIAAGRPLELQQGDVLLRGHAIEARIYAEDAERGFLPTSGSVLAVRWPRGPGVRVDAGVDGGDVVGTRYDGLLAKLCVHGETRARAIARLRAALDDVVVLGLTTNLPLLRSVAAHPEFERGAVDTGWLERTLAARRRAAARRPRRSRPPMPSPPASRARARGRGAGAPARGESPPDAAGRARARRRAARLDRTAATSASSAARWPSPSSTRGARAGAAAAGVARIVAPDAGRGAAARGRRGRRGRGARRCCSCWRR